MFRTMSRSTTAVRSKSGLLAACGMLAAASLGATHASAAPVPASELSAGEAEELCERLDNQFQFTMQFKANLPYAGEARALHASGVEECRSGDAAQGVSDLRKSLETMHVVPNEI